MTPHPGTGHPPPTPAQRRALTEADPATGEIRAGAATLSRLVALGLSRPYGPRGAHYLTAAGRALRQSLRHPDAADARTDAETGTPGFSSATGDGPPGTPHGRSEAVSQAWSSLQEIRRLTAGTAEPAPWERARPVHAVALALEAAGTPPSAREDSGRRTRTGYRVTEDTAEPGTVRVEWRTATGEQTGDARRGLDTCARVLENCGWLAERYTDSRRRPFLLVVPRPTR